MTMWNRASIPPSTFPHKTILPWRCFWFMMLRMLAVSLKPDFPVRDGSTVTSPMDPLHQSNAVPIFHMCIMDEHYTRLPLWPTCTNSLLWPHKYAHMCIMQSHKCTRKQSPIHSQGSVNTFTPLFFSFLSSINTYTRTKKDLYPDVRRRCVHACHGPLMNRSTSRDGRLERGRDCSGVGRRCSKEGVVDAAHSRLLSWEERFATVASGWKRAAGLH